MNEEGFPTTADAGGADGPARRDGATSREVDQVEKHERAGQAEAGAAQATGRAEAAVSLALTQKDRVGKAEAEARATRGRDIAGQADASAVEKKINDSQEQRWTGGRCRSEHEDEPTCP
jgi:hypothetical protein